VDVVGLDRCGALRLALSLPANHLRTVAHRSTARHVNQCNCVCVCVLFEWHCCNGWAHAHTIARNVGRESESDCGSDEPFWRVGERRERRGEQNVGAGRAGASDGGAAGDEAGAARGEARLRRRRSAAAARLASSRLALCRASSRRVRRHPLERRVCQRFDPLASFIAHRRLVTH
jgi:hypothetical protein